MRYRLRTLFILLAIASAGLAWTAWQVRIVATRRAISRELEERGEGCVIYEGTAWGENFERFIEGDDSRRISRFRRWLGDENAEVILFNSAESPKRRVIDAFPEADIYIP